MKGHKTLLPRGSTLRTIYSINRMVIRFFDGITNVFYRLTSKNRYKLLRMCFENFQFLYPGQTKYVEGNIVFVFPSVRPPVRMCVRPSGLNILPQNFA